MYVRIVVRICKKKRIHIEGYISINCTIVLPLFSSAVTPSGEEGWVETGSLADRGGWDDCTSAANRAITGNGTVHFLHEEEQEMVG